MATELFFGSALAQISRGRNDLNKVGSNIGWRALEFKLSSGSSANSTTTVNTVAGPTDGLETRASATVYYEWISPPVSSSVTVAGSITFNICANESAAQANATVSVVLESVDTTGSIKSTIIDSSFVTELGTANAKRTWSATPTSTVVNKAERLRARVYFDDAGTMGSGRTATFTFNGTLANVGDSNITLTEDINFMILAGGDKDIGFDNSTGFNGTVRSFAIDSNGKIYVGGDFTSYKGTTANRIIRLNPDGSKDTGFDNSTGFSGTRVRKIVIDSNGKIYAVGNFTSYKGVTENRIIRLNADGTKDTGFDNSTGFNGEVMDIAIDSNGKIYLVGWFTQYKGDSASGIIRLNPDGTKDTGFDNSTGFTSGGTLIVSSLAIDANGKIYVGGNFTSYKGTSAISIIRLNPDGTKDTGFDNSTGANASVDVFAIDSNGKIYAGGAFTAYKGVTANYIIRLNPDGTKDTGFDNDTAFDSSVTSIQLDSNGKIYAGGVFTSYKGVTENYIIRLNPDGTEDVGFDNTTGFGAPVNVIVIDSNGKIYVGGDFTSYKGTTANYIIRLYSEPPGHQTFYLTNTASTVDQSRIELLASTTRGTI
jgi:uncharacterized delta-60 repeat protein